MTVSMWIYLAGAAVAFTIAAGVIAAAVKLRREVKRKEGEQDRRRNLHRYGGNGNGASSC